MFQVKVWCNFITFFKAVHKNPGNRDERHYISIYCAMVGIPQCSWFPKTLALLRKNWKIYSSSLLYFLYILFISSDFIKQILQCSKNRVSYKVIHLARGCSMLSYSLEELPLWSFSLPKYHRPLGCSIIVVSVSFAETQRMLCKTVKMTLSKDKS